MRLPHCIAISKSLSCLIQTKTKCNNAKRMRKQDVATWLTKATFKHTHVKWSVFHNKTSKYVYFFYNHQHHHFFLSYNSTLEDWWHPQSCIEQIESAIDIYAMRLAINGCFFAYIPPYSGIILAIHYTLYGLCQIRSLDGRTYATKKAAKFWLWPPPVSLETYSFLYLLYTSIETSTWYVRSPTY